MSRILENSIFRFNDAPSTSSGTYRALLLNVPCNRVWAIQTAREDNRKITYHRGPKMFSLGQIELSIDDGRVEIETYIAPTTWLLSDEQIEARYGRSAGSEKCAQLSRRDRAWHVIEPIVSRYCLHDLLELGMLRSAVGERASELGVKNKIILAILHRYWAGASNRNALLGSLSNCGGKGKIRSQARKLGRPNVAIRSDPSASPGYLLSDVDREQLQFGWETFLRPGVSVQAAYLRTMEAFYRADTEKRGDALIPMLRLPESRPTPRQFRYWGTGGLRSRAASRLQLMGGEFDRNLRALPGTARDGIQCVGQVAYCDATTNDVYLVSSASPLLVVGTANRIMIRDAYTGIIAGFYCGFDAPSAETAMQAIAHAALDKVDFCSRFGLVASFEDWPAIAFQRYICDNGEFRAQESIQRVANFGSTLEFTPVGRADLKSPVETYHHVLHSDLDHKIPGTTRGKRTERGQKSPVLSACLTYFEYVRNLVRRILHHNNEERCEDLLTTEMRRDNVVPTRISIYRWCIENGYTAGGPPSADMVRSHLYPKLPAVLTGSGVYLLRPDRGRKAELVRKARFVGKILLERGLMEEARRNHVRLEVRADPNDLRKIWIVHDGVHELINVDDHDPLAVTEWTLQDHLSVQDHDLLERHRSRGTCEQQEVTLDAELFADVSSAKEEKKELIERSRKRFSERSLKSNIRQNRKFEKSLLTSVAEPPSQTDSVPEASGPPTASANGPNTAPTQTSPALEVMRRFNRMREES